MLEERGEIGERSRALLLVLPPFEARVELFAILERCMAILLHLVILIVVAEVIVVWYNMHIFVPPPNLSLSKICTPSRSLHIKKLLSVNGGMWNDS